MRLFRSLLPFILVAVILVAAFAYGLSRPKPVTVLNPAEKSKARPQMLLGPQYPFVREFLVSVPPVDKRSKRGEFNREVRDPLMHQLSAFEDAGWTYEEMGNGLRRYHTKSPGPPGSPGSPARMSSPSTPAPSKPAAPR